MDKHDKVDALIDLGAASVETKGIPPLLLDNVGIGRPFAMSDAD